MANRRRVSAVVSEVIPSLSKTGHPQLTLIPTETGGAEGPSYSDFFSPTIIKSGTNEGSSMADVLTEAYARRLGLGEDATLLDIHKHAQKLVGMEIGYNTEDVIVNGAVVERVKSLWFASDPRPARKVATADDWAAALA